MIQDSTQMAAMIQSMRLGALLQVDHPEVAEWYSDGTHLVDMVKKLGLEEKYGVSEAVARGGVHYAIHGVDGVSGHESYIGLIPDVEKLREIERRHKQEGGRIAADRKLGVHSWTSLERRAASAKGGRIAADRGLGVHAQSHEENVATGRQGALAIGRVPWTDEQRAKLCELAQQPEYQRGTTTNIRALTTELNNQYPDVSRTMKGVQSMLALLKRRGIYQRKD